MNHTIPVSKSQRVQRAVLMGGNAVYVPITDEARRFVERASCYVASQRIPFSILLESFKSPLRLQLAESNLRMDC